MLVYGKRSKRCASSSSSLNLASAAASRRQHHTFGSLVRGGRGWAARAPHTVGRCCGELGARRAQQDGRVPSLQILPSSGNTTKAVPSPSRLCPNISLPQLPRPPRPTLPTDGSLLLTPHPGPVSLPLQVTSLRAQLNGLSGDAVTPVASKRVDALLGGLSTPSPLPATERGGSKSYTRTQSSPALSPRISASLRQLASAVDAGGEGVGIGIGGGIENSPSLNRRNTVGTGTSPADESFTSPAGVAGTGTGTSKAGVLGWWKRNDLREDGQAANKEKPRPITEDQERLGNLYSMIARR